MGAKFGLAWGCHTTVISRGTAKKASALDELKVHDYIDSKDEQQMAANAQTFDFILCTVSASYDLSLYLNLLKTDGQFIVVGAPPEPLGVSSFQLILGRKSVAGSLIGGIEETQEMLDFCGRHNIVCDIEMITANQIDVAYARTINSDVKYRFVIDAASF